MTITTEKRKTMTFSIKIMQLKKQMPDLLWVLKARSIDPTRDALNYLNIDGEGFCATDGHRLHLCRDKSKLPTNVKNGLWDVKVLKDSIVFIPVEDGRFPNYINLMPNYSTESMREDLDVRPSEMNRRLSGCLIDLVKRFGYGLDIAHLKDLSGYSWDVTGDANIKDKPFHFKNGVLEAIIMPIR